MARNGIYPLRADMCGAACRPRCEIGIWNLLACHYVSIGGLLLRLNSHRPQPEYTNEYFLRYRRRGRCTSRCRLLWSAHLNNKILFDLLLVNAVRGF